MDNSAHGAVGIAFGAGYAGNSPYNDPRNLQPVAQIANAAYVMITLHATF
ncbi:MAG: hypothetical protein M1472_00015 [Planctomycetes bacterium]|nr:hypothetical protein [Planctomycetota bacterium]